MQKYKKPLIAVAICTVFLFCFSIMGAAAPTTYQSTFIGDDPASQIGTVFWADDDGNQYLVGPNARNVNIAGNGRVVLGFTVSGSAVATVPCKTVLIEWLPADSFIYNIDPEKYYTFVFSVSTASIDPDAAAMALKDSNGNIVSILADESSAGSGATNFTFTFSPESMSHLENIVSIQFQYRFETGFTGYFRVDTSPYAIVTVEDPTLDAIEGFIQGWTPDAKPPSGAEDFDELESQEGAILGGVNDGLIQGQNLINGLVNNLSYFNAGFVIITGITNLVLNNNTFLTYLLSISLGIGIFVFLLGIAPSYVSSVFNAATRTDGVKKSNNTKQKGDTYVPKHAKKTGKKKGE